MYVSSVADFANPKVPSNMLRESLGPIGNSLFLHISGTKKDVVMLIYNVHLALQFFFTTTISNYK